MREGLAPILGQRDRFTARVERTGSKRDFRGQNSPTVLLADVRSAGGEQVTDHLWFNVGRWAAGLKPGDRISFRATPERYLKGYRGPKELPDAPPPEEDLRLARPTNIRVLREDPGPQLRLELEE